MHRMPVNNGSSRSSYAATSRLFNQHLQNGTFKFESTHCNQLLPLPTSLHYDVSSVASMVDVKTDHGKTRAFLRLALERKLLSSHLRTLCSNAHLLTSKYKRPAFLRAEEEREQFLTHLLTLNAVDLLCFTNTFTTSSLSECSFFNANSYFIDSIRNRSTCSFPLSLFYLMLFHSLSLSRT